MPENYSILCLQGLILRASGAERGAAALIGAGLKLLFSDLCQGHTPDADGPEDRRIQLAGAGGGRQFLPARASADTHLITCKTWGLNCA
ncbi:hypothetical protein RA20_08430 [Leisingera sp. ANG-Vp]|nr:hypothetical protein RA20_08430 [Leisingera sp. ANG-Vp]